MLAQKEKYILEDILRTMECQPPPIRPYKGIYICHIASKQIVSDIMTVGGCPNKSLVATFPHIPNQYVADFIRGYFDGDGSIYYDTTNQNYKSKITCGSKNFIYELHSILKNNIPNLTGYMEETMPSPNKTNGLKTNIILRKNPVYNLHFCASDTICLANYLYSSPSNLRLNRKYDKFVESLAVNSLSKEFYSYEKLKSLIKIRGIKNHTELYVYRKVEKDYKIPCAMNYYGSQYEGANRLFQKYLSYDDAKKHVVKLQIRGVEAFRKWAKSDARPLNIHSNPHKYYKHSGWVNWMDFLGNNK